MKKMNPSSAFCPRQFSSKNTLQRHIERFHCKRIVKSLVTQKLDGETVNSCDESKMQIKSEKSSIDQQCENPENLKRSLEDPETVSLKKVIELKKEIAGELSKLIK